MQRFFHIFCRLCDSVTTVHTEIGAGHVASCVGKKEGDSAHQIFWASHLTLWDEAGPLLRQFWVVVKDLLGAAKVSVSVNHAVCS